MKYKLFDQLLELYKKSNIYNTCNALQFADVNCYLILVGIIVLSQIPGYLGTLILTSGLAIFLREGLFPSSHQLRPTQLVNMKDTNSLRNY